MANSEIIFHDYHKPVLQDGEYTIEVSQKVSIKDNATPAVSPAIKSQSLNFYVSGPRFHLDQSLIYSVYPPHGGKGDYMAALPSLVLNRNTLPWERSPINPDEKNTGSAPWLFLLLIDETETSKVAEKNNTDLKGLKDLFVSDEKVTKPLIASELKRLPKKINYLEIDSSLKTLLPPDLNSLKYLGYTRIKEVDPNNAAEEKAVLLCNRLPRRGHNSTVYLVSVENNYKSDNTEINFEGIINGQGKYIFPYFFKWQFHSFDDQLYCVTKAIEEKLAAANPSNNFTGLSSIYDILYENTGDFVAKLKDLNITDKTTIDIIKRTAKLPGSTFHELLSHLAGSFAPMKPGAAASGISASGTVNLPYNKLDGSQAVSTSAYYRSPLAAGQIDLSSIKPDFPFIMKDSKKTIPTSPGDFKIKDTIKNTDDTTYAAAFELGRLIALDDTDFANEFYKWKNETATAIRSKRIKSEDYYPIINHLPLTDKPKDKPIPQHIKNKFNSWKKLQGLPYRYLVPNPTLLPNESIRFFRLDNNWVNAFICGAFSIGHTVKADLSGKLQDLLLKSNDIVTGFMINSLAVSGWPDFEVDVYKNPPTDSTSSLVPIRKDNLDVNIRIYLFKDSIAELHFHLHPGKLHSGFLYEDSKYTKNGGKISIEPDGNNVIDITDLVSKLHSTSVAMFAGQMMEGTPTVSFKINEPQH